MVLLLFLIINCQLSIGKFVFFCRSYLFLLIRLINDNLYIPYIRFSYVLHIFEHSSYKNFLINIRNLPVIEMTSVEKVYYDQLSSLINLSDWSNTQLLSVSMLDGTLGIINFIQKFHSKTDTSSNEWREALNSIRQEARNRWILDEKIVVNRLKEKKEIDSTCISSTTIAKRRAYFEQRVSIDLIFCVLKNNFLF